MNNLDTLTKEKSRNRISSTFKPPNTMTETVFTNQFFFILNLSEGSYIIDHIYYICIYIKYIEKLFICK